jgi:hypothetical protein
MRRICKNLLIAHGRRTEIQKEGRWKAMIIQALKMLDFSGLLEYRAGEYFTLPTGNLKVKGTMKEVHGIAEA